MKKSSRHSLIVLTFTFLLKVSEHNTEIELYRKKFYSISIMDIKRNINYLIDYKCFFISDVMEIINITENDDLNSIFELYNNHRNEAFIYLADLQLYKLFFRLKFCKIFLARINNMTIGCIYAMKYLWNCGWLGGLLIHRDYRRKGIGRELINKALNFLKTSYVYLFVEVENAIARKFFESLGFKVLFRRLNYSIQTTLGIKKIENINSTYDVSWEELLDTLNFKERAGIVKFGYYPIKLNKEIFKCLKRKGNIIKCGDIIAITGDSNLVTINGYKFVFNNHILRGIEIPIEKKIVEINPFYNKTELSDLIQLINYFKTQGDIVIRTYEDDPLTNTLLSKGELGALVMEL